jgi:uncharacterized SAM-binding protein YcdF (DUF218 family)
VLWRWLRQGIGRLLAGLGLLMVIVTTTPLVSWYARQLAGPWNDPRGDVLIVLGASTLTPGIIGESTYWRAAYALMVYREGGIRRIVLSGAGAAAGMQTFLIFQGVPADSILLETSSTSTRENALYTSRLLVGQPGRMILLTSDYHMFRASRAFRKAGLAILPRPFPDALKRATRWRNRWDVFQDEVIETAKILGYFVRGWI